MTRGDPARHRSLVAELAATGRLLPAHRAAFEAVPREWFIPDRTWVRESDTEPDVPIDRDTEPGRWLDAVYADRAIVTQWDDGATVWPTSGTRPSSSASAPSVVAGMLAELGPQPGESVLEIGTGTGWNAALLAEIVGPAGAVTTVEVDADVAEAARGRLACYPRVDVRTGDGADAITGEFDRVIGTAGVRVGRLPHWWVRSTRPGGIVLAPMRADLGPGPLVRFVVDGDGTASGYASAELYVEFMQLRAQRIAGAGLAELRWDDETAERSHTDLAPWVPLLAGDHRWPIALALPSCRYDVWEVAADRPHGVAWLVDPISRSWASVVPDGDRFLVRQSGPRRLWTEAEAAYRWWQRCGEPPSEAWLWTITAERQTVTLET